MLLRVDVLPEDLEAAEPDGCPLQEALKRSTGVEWDVLFEEVWPSNLAWTGTTDNSQWYIRLPDPIINKLADWDDGKDLAPFSFDLELPDTVVEFLEKSTKEPEAIES